MASSAVIRVYVLEGQYAQLSTLGFPASLVLELQERGLRLDNAKWSSRRSDAGFSVSFFWPAALTPRRRKRRQRRRKPKPQQHPKCSNSICNCHEPSDIPSAAMLPTTGSPALSLIPTNAHHPQPASSSSPDAVSPPKSKQEDSPESENNGFDGSAVSIAFRSPNDSVVSETTDSLQHLEDADSVEFEIKDDEPVVKPTTKGMVGWTPIRVTNCFSTEGEDYSVDYLRKCKKISILCNEDTGWRASIRYGSAMFSTPIAARTRSRTSRDIT